MFIISVYFTTIASYIASLSSYNFFFSFSNSSILPVFALSSSISDWRLLFEFYIVDIKKFMSSTSLAWVSAAALRDSISLRADSRSSVALPADSNFSWAWFRSDWIFDNSESFSLSLVSYSDVTSASLLLWASSVFWESSTFFCSSSWAALRESTSFREPSSSYEAASADADFSCYSVSSDRTWAISASFSLSYASCYAVAASSLPLSVCSEFWESSNFFCSSSCTVLRDSTSLRDTSSSWAALSAEADFSYSWVSSDLTWAISESFSVIYAAC